MARKEGEQRTPLRVAIARGGVLDTRCKVREYASFEDFVAEWEDVPKLRDNSKSSKEGLPYFVGAVLDGARSDKNVTARTLLTLDIEAGAGEGQPPKLAVAKRSLKATGLEAWLYPTASHTDKKPRYRIVVPLAKAAAMSRDELKEHTLAVAKLAGVEDWCKPESWVLSQPMFVPAAVAGRDPEQWHQRGKPYTASERAAKKRELADIPDTPIDPVLAALQRAGLYLREDPKHKGKHFITCPFVGQHGTENDTQTVYYEAHHDGNSKPAVKCFDTEPDENGKPHLTYRSLVNWLREHGHLRKTDENSDTAGELEDADEFWESTSIDHMLQDAPEPLEFVFDKFLPIGRLAVLGGPGGVSKSALALRLLLAASTGGEFGPFKADKPMRCMYLSYEDDSQTFHIRLHAMYDAINESADGLLYDMALVRENLRIRAVADDAARWVLMRKQGHNGLPEATQRLQWLAELLRENRVRLLVIDPVAYVHLLEENDAGEMKALQQALNGLAQYARCAVLALHHMQKAALWASIDDINQGSLRGASSIADNARSVGVLLSMPQKDAPRYGLPATHETVSRYAVFKHVKHNFSGSLGVHVFERRGPLLVPRADIQLLSDDERLELRQERADEKRERKIDAKKQALLEWLADKAVPQSAQQIEKVFFRGAKDRHGIRSACIEDGLIDAPDPAPGKARLHSVTQRGLEYLHGN
jgi:hypothetical protein